MGNDYRRGIVLSALGILIISPDAMLVRLIASADPWQIAFWRTGLMGCSLLAYLLVRARVRRRPAFASIRGKTWIVVGLFSFSNISFIGALTHTSVANTLVILATMPFFAAILGWSLIGEKVASRTWVSIGLALTGTGVLVSGSLGGGHRMGDALALLTALMQGLNLIALRRFSVNDLVPPLCLSGFISALVLAPAAHPLGVSGHDFALLGLIGLVVLPLALSLFFSGARFVPAAEAALFTLIETVLGPFWAWLGAGEIPESTTLIGGAIVFAAIVLNTFRASLEYRRRMRRIVLEKSGG
ncbi:DMT family transporter [Varunaivibrio sulfuroxidans]|uniref:EamA domain-containing membrane protein RarD n=1 Tax=Varunaivibrio sulfuroxidans TaxID=1773489 RepID=A0A4R3JFC9_9PROT|nr:DMT family transporter [Varunaivibrio sulfuroxidans]TCS64808.1 EamA domain-containing membrane protein RarD [Varunaivibrio sulfuroxidans]WES32215.1 DMT family transporter [Varunaivibrio sulfuroxidans]